MKNIHRAALLAAGATIGASTPRAVLAAPRAEPNDPVAMIAQINAAVDAMRAKHEEALAGRVTQEEANALIEPINAEIDRLSAALRSEEHTSELQSLMRTSYAVFCLKKKHTHNQNTNI